MCCWRTFGSAASSPKSASSRMGGFHIVAKMNEALDDVRAAEARRLVQDGYEPVLKKTRWCVLKRKSNLTNLQRFRLRDLLRYNLKTWGELDSGGTCKSIARWQRSPPAASGPVRARSDDFLICAIAKG